MNTDAVAAALGAAAFAAASAETTRKSAWKSMSSVTPPTLTSDEISLFVFLFIHFRR